MCKGQQKREEAFENEYVRNYHFQVQELDDHWLIKVRNEKVHTVVIMKEPGTHGSRFGTCTCGAHKVLGVLCEHMVAVVKIGQVPDLTEENVMPYWRTVTQMRMQFRQDLNLHVGMDMDTLKNMGHPCPNLYYCPDFQNLRKLVIQGRRNAFKVQWKSLQLAEVTRVPVAMLDVE